MPALLHFDVEFTHPVPRLGRMMQIGMVAHRFYRDTMSPPPEDVRKTMRLRVTFPVDDSATVTDWVEENQAKLLARCRKIPAAELEPRRKRVRNFLRKVATQFEGPVIPAGWVLGSDMAYLLDLLGKHNELVHYSALDLKPLAMALTQKYDLGDGELAKFLGVPELPEEKAHDALVDAEHQAALWIASLEKMKTLGGARKLTTDEVKAAVKVVKFGGAAAKRGTK